MSILPKPTPAPTPKTDTAKQIALIYAALLVIMSVTQLFTFEDFLGLIPQYHLPMSTALETALAPVLVAAEVFAIPFLLRMALSPAFRWFSMFLGWLVAALWLFITFWIVSTSQAVETTGFTGTLGTFPPGWWAVCMSIAFAILAAWASWGMWPASKAKK